MKTEPIAGQNSEPARSDKAILPAVSAAPVEAVEVPKLWLWKNFVDGRPEYWAFDNPYPTNLDNADPQTLGEPCGYALFKPSRVGRTDRTEAQVLHAISVAAAKLVAQPPQPVQEVRTVTDEEIINHTRGETYVMPDEEKLVVFAGRAAIACFIEANGLKLAAISGATTKEN